MAKYWNKLIHSNILGVTITDDGKCEAEIRKRIEIARQRFINMKDVLTTRSLRIEHEKES